MNRQVDVKAIITHIIRGDGLNKCRICMGDTKEGQVHLDDTVMMDGEKAVTLSEILEIITGLEVLIDEDLPNGLCSSCAMFALNAANFRLLCHQAASQWKLTIQLLNSLPSKNKNPLFAILENNQIVIIDNKKLNYTTQKVIHTANNKIKTPTTYRCLECHKGFQYPIQLFYHLKESYDYQACYICGKIMSRVDLILHTADNHKLKLYDCKECSVILLSYKQFIAHNTKAHTQSSNMCVDCGRGFQSGHALHAHCAVHQPKTCPSCDKLFRNQPCYLHHVKDCCKLDKNRPDTHCTKNKMTVVVNNKKTNKKIKVGMHGSTNKSCVCDYCGKTFAAKKFVAAHIQIVHLKNTHRPCLYCGKLLAAAHMTEHVKRHLSNHSYTCDNCGIVLKTKLGYIQHKRLHTGEKPYTCKYCGETFSASSRRSEHVRKIHNTKEVILKHACGICPARFRLPYRLQKHMHTVHKNPIGPVKQFGCGDCVEKFDTHRGLLHHKRRKHQLPGIHNNK